MLVNNETGVIQPLDRLIPKIREAGSLLLADCAQLATPVTFRAAGTSLSVTGL